MTDLDTSRCLSIRSSLAVSEDSAAGMLLQQLPPQLVTDPTSRERQWEHLVILGQTVTEEELLSVETETLLKRLYLEDPVRLVDDRAIAFECSCSALRTARSIIELGTEQLEYLFAEDELIFVDCEFCLSRYEYSRETLSELVRSGELH